jgi:hypothetical protein
VKQLHARSPAVWYGGVKKAECRTKNSCVLSCSIVVAYLLLCQVENMLIFDESADFSHITTIFLLLTLLVTNSYYCIPAPGSSWKYAAVGFQSPGQRIAASVFVLLYQQLRQYLYSCTSQPGSTWKYDGFGFQAASVNRPIAPWVLCFRAPGDRNVSIFTFVLLVRKYFCTCEQAPCRCSHSFPSAGLTDRSPSLASHAEYPKTPVRERESARERETKRERERQREGVSLSVWQRETACVCVYFVCVCVCTDTNIMIRIIASLDT